jgi:O-acetyl-ADP-ribose deacetylase (regulator of RNase III)
VYSGSVRDAELLASCYRNSFRIAVERGLKSLAFPAISTGVYGYPLDEAASVSLTAVKHHLEDDLGIQLVRFVLFDRPALAAFESAAHQIFRGGLR